MSCFRLLRSRCRDPSIPPVFLRTGVRFLFYHCRPAAVDGDGGQAPQDDKDDQTRRQHPRALRHVYPFDP